MLFFIHQPSLTSFFAGKLMLGMLPLLMMRHRRIPRAKWTDKVSGAGKHWIEQVRTTLSILCGALR